MHRSLTNHSSRLESIIQEAMRILLVAAVLAGLIMPPHALAQDIQRGYRNYQEILRGTKKLEQLTPQERSEVLLVHRRIKARSESGSSSECREARDRARSAAQELADYSRRLRNCAEGEDFSDDCSMEFRRVRDAHSDYESATSDVSSYCR
jgi:hypothetical protein